MSKYNSEDVSRSKSETMADDTVTIFWFDRYMKWNLQAVHIDANDAL